MDGIHDVGGMQGFGALEIENDEPVFHHDWEKRVFALTMATPFVAEYGDDQFRRHIESISPQQYLNSSYYQLWLEGFIRLLQELDVLSDRELINGKATEPLPEPFALNRQPAVESLMDAVLQGESQAMPDAAGPHRFVVGDRVVTRTHMPSIHNRLPRYARGKDGKVVAEYGQFIFADMNSVGDGPAPQMLYGVEFTAEDLWGSTAEPGNRVCLDLWDAYLVAAE